MEDMAYYIFMLFAGFLIAASASIIIEVPKQFIIKNGIIGIIAEAVFLISHPFFNDAVSVFLACLVVTFISHLSARLFKAPVTVFYIPVFFIFVPGAAIYEFAYYLIQSDKMRTADALIEALNIAGAVALGVFISDSLLEIYSHCRHHWHLRRKGGQTK